MEENKKMPFGKNNYIIMLAGIVVLALGFFIMTLDKAEYGFGFLGLTLGPIVVLLGFAIEFYALFSKPKS
ncbi:MULTISPECIES: DUF3098 domain-containing protein [Persicobacter]|uniref:DUF3098 domain-containing protein n=1 Tax=Persicobacter diffluens TaxID=981 RepID=A0AAN5AJD1_9BACT|nr:DUF3098 domain-containing protein [Persicobacter sp. CCB-QB2]GJM60762.1 hypothetical protein PEDI_13140 [Persicobacter diffluens]